MNLFLQKISIKNRIFAVLFLVGSVALLAGSSLHILPFSLVEDLGFITGALTVWLTVIENIWNFPVGIANDLFFFVLFLQARFFADMSLQLVYVLLGFQGWYLWLRGGKNKSILQVSHIGRKELLILLLILLLATYVMMLYLQKIQDAAPLWDALTTVLSLLAQYMLNKKYLENWYFWILADVIYIPLYTYKQLYLTSAVYLIFLGMCLLGLRAWQQSRMKNV